MRLRVYPCIATLVARVTLPDLDLANLHYCGVNFNQGCASRGLWVFDQWRRVAVLHALGVGAVTPKAVVFFNLD